MANMDWITPDMLRSEATAGHVSLSVPREAAKGMTFYDVRINHAPIRLKLSNDITTAFEPSSWGNTEASRVTLTLDVPDVALAAIFELEDSCRQLLQETHPDVRSLWTSVIKTTDTRGGRLRTKIILDGPWAARFYDEANQTTSAPDTWQNRSAQVVMQVRGIYAQKQGIGLMLDTTDVKIGPPIVKLHNCPFD